MKSKLSGGASAATKKPPPKPPQPPARQTYTELKKLYPAATASTKLKE